MTSLAALLLWLPAIAAHESYSCRVPVQDLDRPPELRSYGCHGVRLIAYADAMKVDPKLMRADPVLIINRLRDDPKFNRRAAAAYIKWLHNHPLLKSECSVLLAYNAGPTGARRWMDKHGDPCKSPYVLAVRKAREAL